MSRSQSADETTYDGFISYSHAADGLLAPRLQSGLQQFAKPWWRRRAVRIFRDESSLSANPHLWSSITEALDSSEWFVLLLSPDAAESPWVNQEIEYWRTRKDPSRILPVLTGGTFEWSDGDVSGSAVPDQLRAAFSEEPRWVDLRFAQGEEQLDLKNPRFADGVADIASALRGVPKDELASEEVRQHRRNIRTAWGAASLVGLLAVVAVLFAIQSASNAERAEAEAERANQEAKRAEENTELATREAGVARGRELAASAVVVSEQDSQLSLLLGMQAINELPPGEPIGSTLENALRVAMSADRLIARNDAFQAAGPSQLDLAPDGQRVVLSSLPLGQVAMLDAETLELLWTLENEGSGFFHWVTFSSDGKNVAVSVADASYSQFTAFSRDDLIGPPRGRVLILDSANGQPVDEYVIDGACGVLTPPGSWRADLGLLAIGYTGCGADEGTGSVRFVNPSEWTTVHERTGGNEPHAMFAAKSNVVAFFSGFNTGFDSALLDPSSWEEIRRIDYPWGELSPDGEVLAGSAFGQLSGVILETVDEGVVVDRFSEDATFPWDPEFSPGGELLAYATFGDVVHIVDPDTGVRLETLKTGPTDRAAFDGDSVYTIWEGVVSRWDAAGLRAGDLNTEPLGLWVNGNSIYWAEGTVVAHVADRSTGEWFYYPVDPESGRLLKPIDATDVWSHTPISDNRMVLFRFREVAPDTFELGPMEVLDLMTGSTEVVAGCWMDEPAAYRNESCADGTPHPAGQLVNPGSRHGHEFMIIDYLQQGEVAEEAFATIWDSRTMSVKERISLGVLPAFEGQLRESAFTDDVIILKSLVGDEVFEIIDRETGEPVVFDRNGAEPDRLEHDRSQNRIWIHNKGDRVWLLDLDQMRVEPITDTIPGSIRALGSSPSGDKIAVGAPDDNLRIFSETGEPLHVIPITNPSDVWWLDETHLAVGTGGGPWTVITLNTDELIGIAQSRIRRPLSASECTFYEIDPCPTLEEMRGGG